ncbi:hypothetical protein AB0F81_42860 [Actinoplanes sp. NPDC024001]|uniref:hypothetical protein n=1 Tax=Actinoplanes sp. NPDC024001 TaxID=3154598 RepID=UPI0033EE6B14
MNLDESLRALDAAGPLTTADRERAAADLERIVATGYDAPTPARRSRRRLVIAAAATTAAAVLGAALVLPGNLGGGRAYASWTPVPTPLSSAEIDLIGAECRDEMDVAFHNLDQAELVLAERRGEYAALLYRVDNPSTGGACLAHNVPGSDDVDDVVWGVSGSSGPARKAPAGHYLAGGLADFGDASIIEGAAGPDVTAVTVHIRDLSVQASLKGGRYVAWWPGTAIEWTGRSTTRDLWTVDLTLRDGTVIKDAKSWRG